MQPFRINNILGTTYSCLQNVLLNFRSIELLRAFVYFIFDKALRSWELYFRIKLYHYFSRLLTAKNYILRKIRFRTFSYQVSEACTVVFIYDMFYLDTISTSCTSNRVIRILYCKRFDVSTLPT